MCKIRYYRLNEHHHVKEGAITVASDLVYTGQEYPSKLEFAVSFTNPKDMFIKKVGSGIAKERLRDKHNQFFASVPLNANRKLHYYEIDQIIETYIASIMRAPSWVTKFFLAYNWS